MMQINSNHNIIQSLKLNITFTKGFIILKTEFQNTEHFYKIIITDAM